MSTEQPRNRLGDETSPYLLQHAENPVAWQPWDEEALALARREDKPILLSIGYSACHWCHVMAHESFEDEATARVMNELFVNIKVDREERPDLDKIYQTAHALLAQRAGGWPLTMFLRPDDQVPFFGGTYFPDVSRHGLPAFKDLLVRVAHFYREHRQEIEQQSASMVDALGSLWGTTSGGGPLDPSVIDRAREQLAQSFEPGHGGFGRAPKFPHPTSLERLLRHWAKTASEGQADEDALRMVLFTLRQMSTGGLYDQLGGGFCRYSVDDQWMIPHFEKMLYDNGPLLTLYSEAAAATGDGFYATIARGTADWVMREMQSSEGGFFSSLDADSEGVEGKFYVWTRTQVESVVGSDDYPLLAARFGLDREPNFEGRWHLRVVADLDDLGKRFDLAPEELAARLDTACRRLFEDRERRVRPGRDEKILTSWNALMIKGLATAARHLGDDAYRESAERALSFIRRTLWQDGRLLATYKDGRAHLKAYLDDYAFLLDAVLALLQVRWRNEDLALACELADALLDHFQDPDHGGFYFTADDHERLVRRPKSLADEATPSGQAVAALGLLHLGHLLGDSRYLEAAERALRDGAQAMLQAPMAHCALVSVLEEYLRTPQIVVLRGREPALAEWQAESTAGYVPRRLTLAIPANTEDLPAGLAEKEPRGEVVGYVCEGTRCSAPIESLQALREALNAFTAAT